jgi:FlaA1/EpsC-like NDP-sugar epimerase
MVRYFMTIPEAAQLVLQAAATGHNGDVYILDMGEPVRVVDLARDLIRLSGLEPDVDVAIAFSGVRPGEKLREELVEADEPRGPTRHEKIFVTRPEPLPPAVLNALVDDLVEAALHSDGDAIRRLFGTGIPGAHLGVAADPVGATPASDRGS